MCVCVWGGGYIWVTAQDLGTCHTGDKSALKTVDVLVRSIYGAGDSMFCM